MKLLRRPNSAQMRDCAVTIGGFDGVHLGHWALIERVLVHARRRALPAIMMSFEPLPREVVRALDPPPRLTNFRERWRLLEHGALQCLWLLPFDRHLREHSADEFMQLLRAARARVVVVGHDFRFGRGGEHEAKWCAAQAPRYGFEVDILPPVLTDGVRISSDLVRAALAAGDFARAHELLGRPYAMRGRVRHGDRLGRQLGFPTANIAVQRRRLALMGIFAVRVREHAAGQAGAPARPGVASLGLRPMVGGRAPLLEAHLFDFDGDLYGRELEVEFVAKLREEQVFESMDAMVAQMHRDAQAARTVLGA
jgi:riboflavin kinase/FMN adenylyltransferase